MANDTPERPTVSVIAALRPWAGLIALVVLIVAVTACGPATAQANTAATTGTTAPTSGPLISVAVEQQTATVTWEEADSASGYSVAWVNMPDMIDAVESGVHWTERMARTDVPSSRSYHQIPHLQPETRHAFAVGAKQGDDDTFLWSPWAYATTMPAEPCACAQEQQTPTTGDDQYQAPPEHVAAAREAIAEHDFRVSVNPEELVLVHSEPVTWPDGSIGCAQEGYAYTAAEVPGSVMLFKFYDQPIFVHVSHDPLFVTIPANCQ